ncbi:MAG: restriction endonuclease subunit S [SAR324 cluster bacterium]|nr:restriction endonuclease subunit S [SAR324 cluster bacterium]
MSRKFQTKTIPSRWLENNSFRLDCGPYMSGSIEAKETINKLSVIKEPLSVLTEDIINAGRLPRNWVTNPNHGIPFLSSSDILQADLSNVRLNAKSTAIGNPNLIIKEKTILITRSGTVGRLAYTRSDMDKMACTEHVLRVIPNENKIKPGYLYAYLSSKYGIPMVVSGTYGAIIQHIEPQHIADLPVPRLGEVEDKAHDLMQQSSDLLTKCQKNLSTATKLYFESVNLKDVTASEWHDWGSDLNFSVTLKNAGSLRALNFNPRFQKLCQKIRQSPWKPLKDICIQGTLKRGPRYKRIDTEPEFGYQLIGQKQIFWLYPEGRWIARKSVGDDILVPDGAILVAAQGTLGESELFSRSEFIHGKLIERAYSEHFLRIIADESVMGRGALYSFTRSETAFRMFRSISIGSKLQDFHPTLLANLPIPIPPESILKDCNQLVVEAYDAREKAIELEDEARTLVEEAIKKGGR